MKKVFIAAALAAMIVSCGSKGNKSAEMIAESESDSLFAVNDSTLGDLQTYTYEGVLPGADVSGINYLLTLQETGEDSLGTYNLTTTYLGANNGQDQVFTDSGTVVTIIGIPNDSTAIIWFSRFFVGIIFYLREVLLTLHYEKRLFEHASQPRVAGSDIRLLSHLWSRTNLSRDSYQSG